jgi:hypothetical protein
MTFVTHGNYEPATLKYYQIFNFSPVCSDAELTYGSLSVDATEQMKEIGELGLHIWKTQMIEPLTKVLQSSQRGKTIKIYQKNISSLKFYIV